MPDSSIFDRINKQYIDKVAKLQEQKRKIENERMRIEAAKQFRSDLHSMGFLTFESDPVFKASPAASIRKADLDFLKILPKIIAEISKMEGPKGKDGETIVGPRGARGLRGLKGEKGDSAGMTEIDMTKVLEIVDKAITDYEAREGDDDDPFLIGTKKVDQSAIGDGKALVYDQKNDMLVYRDLSAQGKGSKRFVGGTSYATLQNHPFSIVNILSSATVAEGITLIDASAGNVVVTLPLSSSGRTGRPFIFKKIDSSANTVTITPSGSDLIEGLNTYVLATQWATASLAPDGVSNYYFLWN